MTPLPKTIINIQTVRGDKRISIGQRRGADRWKWMALYLRLIKVLIHLTCLIPEFVKYAAITNDRVIASTIIPVKTEIWKAFRGNSNFGSLRFTSWSISARFVKSIVYRFMFQLATTENDESEGPDNWYKQHNAAKNSANPTDDKSWEQTVMSSELFVYKTNLQLQVVRSIEISRASTYSLLSLFLENFGEESWRQKVVTDSLSDNKQILELRALPISKITLNFQKYNNIKVDSIYIVEWMTNLWVRRSRLWTQTFISFWSIQHFFSGDNTKLSEKFGNIFIEASPSFCNAMWI